MVIQVVILGHGLRDHGLAGFAIQNIGHAGITAHVEKYFSALRDLVRRLLANDSRQRHGGVGLCLGDGADFCGDMFDQTAARRGGCFFLGRSDVRMGKSENWTWLFACGCAPWFRCRRHSGSSLMIAWEVINGPLMRTAASSV